MMSSDLPSNPLTDLDALRTTGLGAFESATTPEAVEAARVEYLGQKQGRLKGAQERLKSLAPADRREYGQKFNVIKATLETAFQAAKARLQQRAAPLGQIDVTLPGIRPRLGHKHPLSQTADELIDLFGRFGFQVARGPEVEDIYHNFEALNIPPAHPARDPLDNFYLAAPASRHPDSGENSPIVADQAALRSPFTMLRSQTSTVQIRVMESQEPPVRVIAIGRVYRPDTVDATHSFMFHQIEGLMVDRGVTMADLKSVLRLFAQSYLGRDVKVRFRPSFFPFTEPSVEVDMLWHGGERWVEMGGAGMVDPNVLRSVGYDPEEMTGFAFGLGIERLCMRRHGIDDIRLLYQNDVRFLRQF
ncbi:MAG: phenylalanine--tRNA ligase subunit alpha [Isosphaeraceae bacterium]